MFTFTQMTSQKLMLLICFLCIFYSLWIQSFREFWVLYFLFKAPVYPYPDLCRWLSKCLFQKLCLIWNFGKFWYTTLNKYNIFNNDQNYVKCCFWQSHLLCDCQTYNSTYRRISISRTRISQILRNSKRLSESRKHFDYLLQPWFCVGDFFTSPNYPKCKLICTSGKLNL